MCVFFSWSENTLIMKSYEILLSSAKFFKTEIIRSVQLCPSINQAFFVKYIYRSKYVDRRKKTVERKENPIAKLREETEKEE